MVGQHTASFTQRFGLTGSVAEDQFPETARTCLHHILTVLEQHDYVRNWAAVIAELERVARVRPGAGQSVSELLTLLPWANLYTFCERVYSNLLVEPTEYNSYTRDVEVTTPLADVQAHYVKEINQLLSEEGLPYEFRDGQFVRPGKQSTQQATARATYVLGARGLRDARAHFIKALDYFRKSPEEADHPNAVKEAVSALEAAAKALFPDFKTGDLPTILKKLQGTDENRIPPALVKAMESLYVFRGAGQGVSHGGANGGVVTAPVAELALSTAAAYITYLADVKAARDADVPF